MSSPSKLIRYALLLLVACQASGSCSGCSGLTVAPYPAPAPPGGAILDGAMRLRVTQTTLDFLKHHLFLVLGQAFTLEGGRAVLRLDEDAFEPDGPVLLRDGCIGAQAEPCLSPSHASTLGLDLGEIENGLELAWLPPDSLGRPGLRFLLHDVEIFLDLAVVTNVVTSSGVDLRNAVCHVYDTGDLAAVRLAELGFDLRFTIDASSSTPRLSAAVVVATPDLGGTSDESAINLLVDACNPAVDPSCADPLCACDEPTCTGSEPALEHCQDVCGLIDLFTTLSGFVQGILQPLLDALTPRLGEAVSAALVDSLADIPLSVETQLELLSSLAAGGQSPFAIAFGVSEAITVAPAQTSPEWVFPGRGLDLPFAAGVAATSIAPCAAGAAPPALSVGAPPTYSGFVEVSSLDGQSHIEMYHLALSLAEASLAQLAWSAFSSGALCMELEADQVYWLLGPSLPFTAALLESFDQRLGGLADPDAPLAVALRPSGTPTIRLGAGREVATGVYEPLVALVFDDLVFDLYLHVDETPTRIAGLTLDAAVQLELERLPGGDLEVVVHGISISDTRSVYDELTPNVDMAGLVQVIADFVLDNFFEDAVRIPLPIVSALGASLGMPVNLHLNAVRKDVGPQGDAYLSVYLTLCSDTDIADPDNITCYRPAPSSGRDLATLGVRLADEASLYVPIDPLRHPADRFTGAPSGRARLEVLGDAGGVEVSYRVDGGYWSTYRRLQGSTFEVESARLLVLGEHTLETRLRAGDYEHVVHPAAVTFWVDRERPWLRTRYDGARIDLETSDFGARDAVELFARRPAGAWQRLEGTSLSVAGETGEVVVLARDLAGNTTQRTVTLDPALSSRAPARHDAAEPASCAATGAPAALVLAVLLLARRRR